MISSRMSRSGACLLLLLAPSGCMFFGPQVWVDETDELVIEAGELRGLALTTHNGEVTVRGEEGRSDIVVRVHKSGGGQDELDAQSALRAIELLTQTVDGVQDVRWRWNPSRDDGWGAKVAYEVVMPTRMTLRAKTHNGTVTVHGIDGETVLESHNGNLSVESGGMTTLTAETHNGRIGASAPLESVRFETHNGHVEIDVRESERLSGSIQSHNGRLVLRASPDISARFDCQTHNGGIDFELPGQPERGKRTLKATVGSGGAPVQMVTHNGRIQILSGRRFE